ncbi:hypothetical protein [Rhodococcus ruber]|uniref:hypothetical protein n=1 Tax=Rhodococcus ruber TaxID=1830 RepID=UPI0011AB48E3|nr:hypothetical protein [Rhodococcus ruber]
MQDLFDGKHTITVTKDPTTGEYSHEWRQDVPPEEAMESLAARLRPLLLASESVHYKKVLDSIASLVPSIALHNYSEPIDWWRDLWDRMAERNDVAQAYMVITQDGLASDRSIMFAWLYADLVHADQLPPTLARIGIDERYRAAAGVVSRICSCVELTLGLVELLHTEGLLSLAPAAFERAVVVTDTTFRQKGTVYTAEESDGIPQDLSDLDPTVWSPVHNVVRPAEIQTPNADDS